MKIILSSLNLIVSVYLLAVLVNGEYMLSSENPWIYASGVVCVMLLFISVVASGIAIMAYVFNRSLK